MAKANTKTQLTKEDLQSTWKSLEEGASTALDTFDKVITALASGALGLSLLFMKDLIKQPAKYPEWLIGSWICFAVVLCVNLLSFLVGFHAFERQAGIAQEAYDANDEALLDQPNHWKIAGMAMNWLAVIVFILGVICTIVFATNNLQS